MLGRKALLMKRTISALLALAIASVASACGGNDSGPSPVVPNYAGNWSGNYVITGCSQTGGIALANVCRLLGTSATYSFSLTQSSRNVAGSFALGSVSFPNTGGAVATDGSLALSGTAISDGVTVVVNWALTLATTALAGTVSQQFTSTVLSGQANVVGTISTANRTALLTAPSAILPKTLGDFVRAMTVR